MKFLSIALLSFCMAVLSLGVSNAQDCETVQGNPFTNCGFETGDFTGWVTQDITLPFLALQVGGAGIDQSNTNDFGFFLSDPTQGVFAALTGFDGSRPGNIRIAQDIFILPDSTELVFDYRCAWNLEQFGASEDRTFAVNIEGPGGGAVLQSDLIFTAEAGTNAIPDSGGNMTGVVDMSAFAGQAVRVSFDWFVPQQMSGPAFCQLDNVSIEGSSSFVRPIPTLSEWGLIAMAGVLGVVGLIAIRRKSQTA